MKAFVWRLKFQNATRYYQEWYTVWIATRSVTSDPLIAALNAFTACRRRHHPETKQLAILADLVFSTLIFSCSGKSSYSNLCFVNALFVLGKKFKCFVCGGRFKQWTKFPFDCKLFGMKLCCSESVNPAYEYHQAHHKFEHKVGGLYTTIL